MTSNITLPPRNPASEPNPTFVRLLNAALPFLWDGMGDRYETFGAERGRYREKYVCPAITEGAPDEFFERGDWKPLTDLIDQRLNGATFDGWACRQGVDELDTVRIQAGRRAWVQDLISEFGG